LKGELGPPGGCMPNSSLSAPISTLMNTTAGVDFFATLVKAFLERQSAEHPVVPADLPLALF